MPVIVSLQSARPTTYVHAGHADGKASTWTTAFFKTPVAGPVRVNSLGVAGDEQADQEDRKSVV